MGIKRRDPFLWDIPAEVLKKYILAECQFWKKDECQAEECLR